ncbi:MAG: RNA methyltransferase [Paludibacteraceae bacterium]|nr:RNA methyltransferase [Paludibacteraceae bacterium]
MNIIEVTSLTQEGLDIFANLTDAQLTDDKLSGRGLFIAESCKVINVALNAGYEPVALLTEAKHVDGYAADLLKRIGSLPEGENIPVYVGPRELLRELTGYTLTRSVLCAMRRKQHPSVEQVVKNAHRVVVIDAVVNTTNIGAIFRSAAALDIDAVLLTPYSCDPLNRRAVRVSMGNIFLIPWTWMNAPVESLHDYGFQTVAMALRDDSVALDDPCLKCIDRLALIMGSEGDGLPVTTIHNADYVVRIPMSHGVDSLNVAAASAVAFWELRKR